MMASSVALEFFLSCVRHESIVGGSLVRMPLGYPARSLVSVFARCLLLSEAIQCFRDNEDIFCRVDRYDEIARLAARYYATRITMTIGESRYEPAAVRKSDMYLLNYAIRQGPIELGPTCRRNSHDESSMPRSLHPKVSF